MKVLFIYPDIYSTFSRHYHIGIGSISAVLKKYNHKIRLVYVKNKTDAQNIWSEIKDFDPQVIAFSTTTAMKDIVRDISSEIKKQFPKIYQICGGIHPTLCPSFLEATPSLDAISRGESEWAMLDFIERLEEGKDFTSTENFWFRVGASIIKNRLRPLIMNLDELPYPDRAVFDYERISRERAVSHSTSVGAKAGEFLFMRGCPFNCTHCSNRALRQLYDGQQYVRWPSVEWAIGQIQEVIKRYFIDLIFIHDDSIGQNKEWLFDFLGKYKQYIKLPFWVNLRIGAFDDTIIKALKEAGCCRAIIGIESGSEKIRADVLHREMSNQEISEAFRLVYSYGIQTSSQNMVGIPYERPRDFEETIKLNAAIIPNDAFLNVFQPYPGTALGEVCEENGWINHRKADFVERTDTVLKLPGFRRKDILFYYRNFNLLVQRMWRAQNEKLAFLERLIPILPPYFFIIKLHENSIRFFKYLIKICKIFLYKNYDNTKSAYKRYNASL